MNNNIKVRKKDININLKEIIYSFKLIPRLFSILFNVNKLFFSLIIVFTIIMGIFPILSLISVQYLINELQINITKNFQPILIASLIYLTISIGNQIFSLFKNYIDEVYQQYLIYNLNLSIVEKSMNLELKDFENSDVYDKLSRAKTEVAFRPFQIFSTILSLLKNIITLFSSIVIVIAWKPVLVILLVIVPIICSIYTLKIGKLEFLTKYYQTNDRRKVWYFNYLMTNDIAFKEIKFYNLGSYLLNKYKKLNLYLIDQDKYVIKQKTILLIICQLLQEISSYVALVLVILSAFLGQILLGTVVGLIRAIGLVQTNVEAITNTILNMYKNNLFLEQLFEFLDLEESNIDKKNEGVKISEINKIEFKNVYFKYPNKNLYSLKNINLVINKGDSIALVGQNGSGKTTLVKILVRLYEINEGQILINDIPIERIDITSLRSTMATVFQDFLKYQFNLKTNIGVGCIDNIYDEDLILEACKYANITDLNVFKEKGLNAQLGTWFPNGTQLSGGEWQKIAIARAFFRKSSLLIFDEPSSALDPKAEKLLFDQFIKLSNNKIGIFITHRFINVKHSNKIIFLEKGEVIGNGTHDELLNNNSKYKELFELQINK